MTRRVALDAQLFFDRRRLLSLFMNERSQMIRRILLTDLERPMLIVEHSSGVVYQNQVGGVVCWKAELEGVLAPLDISEDRYDQLAAYPYGAGREGIDAVAADAIDALLTAEAGARFVTVDRERLDECWEAWIYVRMDTPVSDQRTLLGPYFGSPWGFGATRGVLTWPNSD